jgi:hypothetical protein
MSFSEASNKITQTGTDTDLTGLNAVTGVTTTTRGNHTTYTIASTHFLEVQGTLSIDPAYETLQLMKQAINANSGHPLTVTGTLNLGVKTSANGKDKYSVGVGIDLPNENLTGQMYRFFGISFGSNSTFLWNGGIIRTTATLRTANGATVTVNSGIFYNLAVQGLSNTNTSQFRIESSNSTSDAKINIYDLTFDGETLESRIFTKSGWNVGIFKFKKGGFQSYNSPFPPLTFDNFDTSPNLHGFDIINVTRAQADGETITIKGFSDRLRVELDTGRDNFMYLKCVRPISLVVEDLNGNPLTYSYYAKDLDSSNRALGPKKQDDRSDKIYNGVNQTSNLDEDVLVEVINYINKTITTDSRTNSNSEIPFSIIAYNQTITGFAEDLVGLDTLQSTVKMTPDLVVSEATKSVVDAYASIDTPQKFYDIAKSYLVDNYAGEASPLVSRSGNTINAGSYNVVIDNSSMNAFSLSGNTITIKSPSFTGNIITLGIVTLIGSISYVGTITDVNGVRSFGAYEVNNLISGSRVQVYNTTTGTEIYNQIVNSTSFSEGFDTSIMNDGDDLRIRVVYQNGATAKEPQELLATCRYPSWGVTANQEDATQYNNYSVDGSIVSEFLLDLKFCSLFKESGGTIDSEGGSFLELETCPTNAIIEVDISDADNATNIQRVGSWYYAELMTGDGIAYLFGAIDWIEANQIAIDQSKVDLKIDNIKQVPLILKGGRLYRLDGQTIIADNSNSIQVDYDPVYITNAPLIEKIDKNTKLIPALL